MQELEAETKKERCLFPWLAQLPPLHHTQAYLTRKDTTHSGSDTPTSIGNEERVSQTWPWAIWTIL